MISELDELKYPDGTNETKRSLNQKEKHRTLYV